MTIYIKNQIQKNKGTEQMEMPCLHSVSITNLGESILIFGGMNDQKEFSNKIYEFTLNDQSWKEVKVQNDLQNTPKPHERYKHSANLVFSKQILIIGGFGKTLLNDFWIYDHKIQQFQEIQIIVSSKQFSHRYGHQTFLHNDLLYIMFGKGGSKELTESKDLKEVFTFSLTTQKLDQVEVTGQKQWMSGSNFTGQLLSKDRFLLIPCEFNKLCLFNIETCNFNEINTIGDIPSPRMRFSICEGFEKGEILMIGGVDKQKYFNEVYKLYCPKDNISLIFKFAKQEVLYRNKKYNKFSLFPGLQSHSAIYIDKGVLIFGGLFRNLMYCNTKVEQAYKTSHKKYTMQLSSNLYFNEDMFYLDCSSFYELDYYTQTFNITPEFKKINDDYLKQQKELPLSLYQSDLVYWPKIDRLVIYGGIRKNMNSSDEEQSKEKKLQDQHKYLNYLQTYNIKNNTWELKTVINGFPMSCHRTIVYKQRLLIYGGTDGEDTYRDFFEIIQDNGIMMMVVVKIKSIINSRLNPNMWIYKDELFIFGGYITNKLFEHETLKCNMEDKLLNFQEAKVNNKNINQQEELYTINQKEEQKQINDKPNGRMFAAQAQFMHYGVIMGGVGSASNKSNSNIIYNDLWLLDFETSRWIKVDCFDQNKQLNTLYGHSICVYNSQFLKQDLVDKKNTFVIYIDQKINEKQQKLNNTKSKQGIEDSQKMESSQKKRTFSNVETVLDQQQQQQQDIENQKEINSGLSANSKQLLSPDTKKNRINTEENILTEVEEHTIDQKIYYTFDLLVFGGAQAIYSGLTAASQTSFFKVRVFLEKNNNQEKVLNLNYEKEKRDLIKRQRKKEEEKKQRRMKRQKENEKRKDFDILLQQDFIDDTEEDEEEILINNELKYFEHTINLYKSEYNYDEIEIKNKDYQGRIFTSVLNQPEEGKIWIFGGIQDNNMYFIDSQRDFISEVKSLNEVIDFDKNIFQLELFKKANKFDFFYDRENQINQKSSSENEEEKNKIIYSKRIDFNNVDYVSRMEQSKMQESKMLQSKIAQSKIDQSKMDESKMLQSKTDQKIKNNLEEKTKQINKILEQQKAIKEEKNLKYQNLEIQQSTDINQSQIEKQKKINELKQKTLQLDKNKGTMQQQQGASQALKKLVKQESINEDEDENRSDRSGVSKRSGISARSGRSNQSDQSKRIGYGLNRQNSNNSIASINQQNINPKKVNPDQSIADNIYSQLRQQKKGKTKKK